MSNSKSSRRETATISFSLSKLLETECRFTLVRQGLLKEILQIKESLLLFKYTFCLRISEERIIESSFSFGPLEDFLCFGFQCLARNVLSNRNQRIERIRPIALIVGVQHIIPIDETPQRFHFCNLIFTYNIKCQVFI